MNEAARIQELEREIASLPPGYISRKNIRGKVRCYYQWREDGKLKSRYLKAGELEPLEKQIDRRRCLQEELQKVIATGAADGYVSERYACHVLIGPALRKFADGVQDWELRDCFSALEWYLYGPSRDRVCLLFGLTRTGKTTMIRQAIGRMSPEDVGRCAYIKADASIGMDMLNHDLDILCSMGYHYVFLDEVTLVEHFVDSAALFSDVYAVQGMKLVLSGKDSLGFWFSLHEELYDRAYTIHTTWIPFREHSRLLGLRDIEDYIRYGGTLRAGEADGDHSRDAVPFWDDETADRYLNTAISRNIQHSLACYQGGTHFRHLRDLYYADVLTDAIAWTVGRQNHPFLLDVLSRQDGMERQTVRLMELLEMRDLEMQKTGVTAAHEIEIREYLKALEFYVDCPIEVTDPNMEQAEHVLFTQPGMRYRLAEALVHTLMKDKAFAAVPQSEKQLMSERILEDVRERVMGDIVLLETLKAAKTHQQVFKLQLPQGEYDMVVYDGQRDCCAVYEIKHSTKTAPEQRRYLTNAEMLAQTEHRFGPAVGRWVLYRGPSLPTPEEGVSYLNVEEYLEALPEIAFDEGTGKPESQVSGAAAL